MDQNFGSCLSNFFFRGKNGNSGSEKETRGWRKKSSLKSLTYVSSQKTKVCPKTYFFNKTILLIEKVIWSGEILRVLCRDRSLNFCIPFI
jgi:hypothetical protein